MKKIKFLFLYILLSTNIYISAQNNAGNSPILNIGGSIWGEEDGNSMKDTNEIGGARVQVHLLNTITLEWDSVMTENDGSYLFKNKETGFYRITLKEKNFISGGPLYGLKSCDGQESDIITDNDDNGTDISPANTVEFDLTYPNSTQDTITNTTFDFCFKVDCGTPNALTVHQEEYIVDTICYLPVLDVLCSRMFNEKNLSGQKKCNGNVTLYYTEFFSFTAGTGTYSLDINLFGCANGWNGAQVGVEDENHNSVFCTGTDCITGLVSIPSSVLIPGESYIFWINGCNGSLCSYEINVMGNFIQYQIPEPSSIQCSGDVQSLCLGDTINFTPLGIENKNYTYHWRITDAHNISKDVFSKEIPFKHIFNEKGGYTVELLNIEKKCSLPITPLAIKVNVIDSAECSNISMHVNKVVAPDCQNKGYFVADINTINGPPFKVYLNDTISHFVDTFIIERGGYYTIKVVDTLGNQLEKTFYIEKILRQDSFDLEVNFTTTNLVRGFKSQAWISANNFTCKNIDGFVQLQLPKEIIFLGSNPAPIENDGQGNLKWNFTDIGEPKKIFLELKTSLNATIGQHIKVSTSIYPLVGDITLANNIKDYLYPILGAIAPNDILLQPYGKCTPRYLVNADVLNYTIRFQNTGNYPASFVSINDTLSEYLDINSISVIGSSHEVVLYKLNDNAIKFDFPNISLPSKEMDENLSNGYVSFKIALKNEVPENTMISNKAEIYFDFNEAVVTNTIKNTIVENIPNDSSTANISICYGDSIILNGHYFKKDSILTINYLSQDLCDSIVEYAIDIRPEIEVEIVKDGNALKTTQLYDGYTWIDCNTDSVVWISTTPLFYPNISGNYRVKVLKDGCYGESTCTSYITDTKEFSTENAIKIFPNPSSDGYFHIELENTSDFLKAVKVYDVLGRQIKTFKESISHNHFMISPMCKGIYVIEICTKQGLSRRKIIIE